MKIPIVGVSLTVVLSLAGSIPASANYTIVLKNGRQLTVESYREDDSMIKFFGFGGEIAISKDYVQAIRHNSDAEPTFPRGVAIDRARPAPLPTHPVETARPNDTKPPTISLPGQKQLRPTEEKEFRGKLKMIEDDLKAGKDRYSVVTGGTVLPGNDKLNESLKGWTTDLTSKLKDTQNAPASSYTAEELELKELRQKIENLEQDKANLIREMKDKGIDPAAPSEQP